MAKLILQNDSDLHVDIFLDLVKQVLALGRISNDGKQYCYLSSFKVLDDEYHIVSDLNEKSDKLTLYKVPVHQKTETA